MARKTYSGRVCLRDTPFSDDEILKFQILKTKKKPGAAPWYTALVAQRKKVPHGLYTVHGGPCDGYALDLCTEHGNAYTLPMNFLGDIGRYVNGAWQTLETAQEVLNRRAAAGLARAGAANDERKNDMEPNPKRTRRAKAPKTHQAPPMAPADTEPHQPPAEPREAVLLAVAAAHVEQARGAEPAPAEPDQAEQARPFERVDETKVAPPEQRAKLNAPAVCGDWTAHQAQGKFVTRLAPRRAPPGLPAPPDGLHVMMFDMTPEPAPAVLWTAPPASIPARLRPQ